MRTVLSVDLQVTRIAVFAEMAWLERRPELGILCRAALGQSNRITVTTVQAALPGLQDAGAANVIAWCRTLGLCDAAGALTALGEEVASTDEAPVPEQGVYGLWMTDHPVTGCRVLAVERLASNRDQRFESTEPLPIDPDCGRVFRSVVNPKERFQVRDLPANGGQAACIVGETEATCRMRWKLDFDNETDHWRLEGTIEVPQGQGKHALRPMHHEPESASLDLWALAETWATGPLAAFGRWQASKRRLAVSFKDLVDLEQDTFRKSLTLRSVDVPGKGAYEGVTLEDVPVGPTSSEDAQRWAMSRFDRHLAKQLGYRSRASARDLFAELTEGTPLEEFSPMLPAHGDLLGLQSRDALKNPERFWSLAAPVDLAPHDVSSDDLAALRIGAPAPATIAIDPPDVVRIPYRGGWSMRRLVTQLLQGASPRRLLLCDRYVRGLDNLATLKLLVQALRAASTSVTFEVWTGEEEADFKQLQSITGTAARSYREVFGRNIPHDRYFLVLPSNGPGFGWHLTNSPLHARPDAQGANHESPLRWKDLAGTRVSADELEPALRQWLNGAGR